MKTVIVFGSGRAEALKLVDALRHRCVEATAVDVQSQYLQHLAGIIDQVGMGIFVWAIGDREDGFLPSLGLLVGCGRLAVPILVKPDQPLRLTWDWRGEHIPRSVWPYVGFMGQFTADGVADAADRIRRSLIQRYGGGVTE